jgi:hypothetical protein
MKQLLKFLGIIPKTEYDKEQWTFKYNSPSSLEYSLERLSFEDAIRQAHNFMWWTNTRDNANANANVWYDINDLCIVKLDESGHIQQIIPMNEAKRIEKLNKL